MLTRNAGEVLSKLSGVREKVWQVSVLLFLGLAAIYCSSIKAFTWLEIEDATPIFH
ncbi:hypothetical protein J4731_19180 [Providencia rettgeri]|nr:hypothetical protein [Providencia rettgeri]